MSIMVWNKIYRKSLFTDLRFAEGYIHEDIQITPILLHRAKRIGCLNKTFYNYNIHMGNASTTGMGWSPLKIKSLIKMSRSVVDYFKNENVASKIQYKIAELYINYLLTGYQISFLNKSGPNDWSVLNKDILVEIQDRKDFILTMWPSRQVKLFYFSPFLFCVVKTIVQRAKKLKRKLK